MTRRAAVVVNPSKLEDPGELRSRIARRLTREGWDEPLWIETTVEDPGRGMAESAVEAGVDLVLALGGDGTVRAVCTGLAGSGVPLGILPAGTGNLLARNLGLPVDDLDRALDVALGGADHRLDLARVHSDGDECFAVMAGLGFDAAMMRDAPEDMKRRVGSAAYVVSALGHLRDRHMTVTITVDDQEPVRRHARTVLVGNVGELQAGLRLLPDALPDDGLLDVLVVSPRHLFDWVRVAGRVVLRLRREDSRVWTTTGKRVRIEAEGVQPRQLDGDPIADGERLDVELEPAAIVVRLDPARLERTAAGRSDRAGSPDDAGALRGDGASAGSPDDAGALRRDGASAGSPEEQEAPVEGAGTGGAR